MSASQLSAMTVPSTVEEREPKAARIIGLVGGVLLFAALIMSLFNARREQDNERARKRLEADQKAGKVAEDVSVYRIQPPIWKSRWVFLCWVAGVAGLLFHATQDRDEYVRRGYGMFGYALAILGILLISLAISSTLFVFPVTLTVTALIGILLAGLTAVPFAREESAAGSELATASALEIVKDAIVGWPARWFKTLTTSSRVALVTLVATVFVGGLLAAVAALMRQSGEAGFFKHPLAYGAGSLGVGLVFLLTYSANESQPAWRNAAAYVLGGFGFLCALAGLASVFADLAPVEALRQFLLPYGMILSLIGLVLTWTYVSLQNSETDQGHTAAWTMLLIGGAMLAAGLTRSVIQAEADYFKPAGFLVMAIGLGYTIVGGCLALDWSLPVMIRREFASLFYSPIAYVVMGGTAAIGWGQFYLFARQLVSVSAGGIPGDEAAYVPNALPEPIIRGFYWSLIPILFLIFSVPLVTMRLLSEERKSGTIETTLTAPVGEVSVVLSKFLAVWMFFVLAWGTWIVFPAVLRIAGQEPFDYYPLVCYFIGISVIAGGFLAMGLFVSSLFRDQISALLTALVAMLLLVIGIYFVHDVLLQESQRITGQRETLESWIGVFRYGDTLTHMDDFIQGKLHYTQVLYHLSCCVFWLYLTVKVVESRKWK